MSNGTELLDPVQSAAAVTDVRLPSMLTAATPQKIVSLLILLAVALLVLPALLSGFWLQIAFQAFAYSGVALGLGLLVGRTGMYSLCHIPLLAAGAWISLRVANAVDVPFPILLIITGVLTGLVGVVIGLPALRLSGLYLALVTLMAAGAITLLLQQFKFPNGGSGFWGFDKKVASGVVALDRPSIAQGNTAYYRYTVVVVAALFLIVAWHLKGKPGRAWAAIRQSQVTAVAAGIDTTLYKLWAFALSAAVSGVAGALVAAGPGGVTVNQFPVESSVTLLAVVLMGGVYNIYGALVAGFLLRFLPQILDKQLDLPTELLTILFGVGVMQVLLVQPRGIVEDLHGIGKAVRHANDDAKPRRLTTDLAETNVVPRRLAAFAIDGVVLAVVWWVVSRSGSFTFQLVAMLIAYLLVRLLPTVGQGASLGKSKLGLTVVQADGSRSGWVGAIVRDLALVVDVVVGIVLMIVRPGHRRLGDTLGKTLVVGPESADTEGTPS